MILKFELHAKNNLTAIGALAIPVLRYSFGIINCIMEVIRKIDRKTRKVLKYIKCITQNLIQIEYIRKGKEEEEACYKLK